MNRLVQSINTDEILVNPNQPRMQFNEEAIVELANSISENGLIQPIIVRRTQDGFELVAGERRLRATKYLKHPKIEAIVENYNDDKSAKIAIIENIQRENLTAIEEAVAYEKLLKDHNFIQSQLAVAVGKSQSSIANKLRLLNLNDTIKDAILTKQITERHGRALLKLDSEDKRLSVFNKIINNELNVAQTEAVVEKVLAKQKKANKPDIKRVVAKNDYRLEVNTIKQSLKAIEASGVKVYLDVDENDHGVTLEISLKK
jgi:ParB family transcriptional regulator, chromosome partitioning protein